MRTLIAAAVIAAAALTATAACSSAPVNTVIHGTEIVSVSILDGTSASDAYPDVADGGQVTVIDSYRNVVGDGILSETDASIAEEQFKFAVTVPAGLARYGIQVGNNNRGTVWFSNKQMRQGPSLCLGDGCP